MKSTNSSVNQITEGVIWKQLLLFFFPILLGTLFQQLYNTADAIVVGRFVGKEALAAVGGSSGQIVGLVVGFFVGLSSGATVIIARFYGARNKRDLNRALHTAAALAIVGSIIISILGVILAPSMLHLMNTPEEVMAGSVTYLRIYFAGILFVFIYNIGSAVLRAIGDSKRPLYFLIICCFINIVLDVVLVVGFRMGVTGAAIATLVSQAVSAVLIVLTLAKSDDLYQLKASEIHFYRPMLASIVAIGLPAGIQSVMYSVANVIIQSSLNGLGTSAVAANTANSKMDAIYWMVSGAFSVSIATFVGQNYGAGKYSRMRKSVRVCLVMDLIASVLISILFWTCGRYMLGMFTSDPEVLDIGMDIVHVIAPFYGLFIFVEIYSSTLRGIGDVFIPMIMTCCGICVVRILWTLIVVPTHYDIQHILACFPISWGITSILFIIYYQYKQRKFFRKHPVDEDFLPEAEA